MRVAFGILYCFSIVQELKRHEVFGFGFSLLLGFGLLDQLARYVLN